MTHQEQRIAIAEACGITGYLHDLPNYLNDLNAMHEAEYWIPSGSGGFEQYAGWLDELTHDQESPITATAAQRAEAFLRTLNLWKE